MHVAETIFLQQDRGSSRYSVKSGIAGRGPLVGHLGTQRLSWAYAHHLRLSRLFIRPDLTRSAEPDGVACRDIKSQNHVGFTGNHTGHVVCCWQADIAENESSRN